MGESNVELILGDFIGIASFDEAILTGIGDFDQPPIKVAIDAWRLRLYRATVRQMDATFLVWIGNKMAGREDFSVAAKSPRPLQRVHRAFQSGPSPDSHVREWAWRARDAPIDW